MCPNWRDIEWISSNRHYINGALFVWGINTEISWACSHCRPPYLAPYSLTQLLGPFDRIRSLDIPTQRPLWHRSLPESYFQVNFCFLLPSSYCGSAATNGARFDRRASDRSFFESTRYVPRRYLFCQLQIYI